MESKEYRWLDCDDFSGAGRKRADRYYEKARNPAAAWPRSALLMAGQTLEQVLYNLVPGQEGDFTRPRGPFRFWLYAAVHGTPQVQLSVAGRTAEPVVLRGGHEPTWHLLGELPLQYRVPRLVLCHSGGGPVECFHLLFTDDFDLRPQGEVSAVERQVYGFTRADLGTSTLEPAQARVGERRVLRMTYTVGEVGLAVGGGIQVLVPLSISALRREETAALLQTLRAEATGGARLQVTRPDEVAPHSRSFFVTLQVAEQPLSPGDLLVVTLGEPEGVELSPVPEPYFRQAHDHWYTPIVPLSVAVDPRGRGQFVPLAPEKAHRFTLRPQETAQLRATVPSLLGSGESPRLQVVALDEFNNLPEPPYRGTPQWSLSGPRWRRPGGKLHPPEIAALAPPTDVYPALAAGQGAETSTASPVRGAELPSNLGPGVHRVQVRDREWRAVSNPLLVTPEPPPYHLFWGEIHVHTLLSDGLGHPEEAYRHARDVAALDFAALTDHICYLSDADWDYLQDLCAQFNEPGRFVTLNGYEWAGKGGHRNIYTLAERQPPVRGMEPPADSLLRLWEQLEPRQDELLVIPHHSLVNANWEHHHPELERLVEIYSMWGCSERRGGPLFDKPERGVAVQEMWASGARLGVTGGSDNHDGRPGLSGDGRPSKSRFPVLSFKAGLTAVYAEELTREAIFTALRERRCYATTGERIGLEFAVNGVLMGGTVKLPSGTEARELVIRVRVWGTAPLMAVEIVKNNEVVHTHSPGEPDTAFTWSDPTCQPTDPPTYYYLRVRQADGNLAWSSPVWVERGT